MLLITRYKRLTRLLVPRFVRARTFAALGCALAIVGAGCDTLKTTHYNTKDEVKLGREISQEVEKSSKIDTDPADNARIQRIAQPIFAQASKQRGDVTYQIKIIQSSEVNAFSLPGGWIYIYSGLIDKAGADDDAIACVIGHESAHVVRRHVVKMLEDEQKKGIAIDILGAVTKSDTAYQVASAAENLQELHFSRLDEYEADKYGLMFAYNAGDDPYGMSRFFGVLEKLEQAGDNTLPWANDHPITRNRITRVNRLIAELKDNHGVYPQSETAESP